MYVHSVGTECPLVWNTIMLCLLCLYCSCKQEAFCVTQRSFSESIGNPNKILDINHHFSTDLASIGIPFGTKYIGKG